MKKELIEQKWKALEEHFNSRGANGADVVAAFRDFYSLYTPAMPAWLAGLYDHKTGGFYYSNSARDNEPFRPDIESTNQALNLMINSGMISSADVLPEKMKDRMREFVCSLEDPEDGYIYHPQWGKAISDSRRGRDLMWAESMGSKLSFKLPYPTANARLAEQRRAAAGDNKKPLSLPQHLTSREAFVKYLESFDWINNSYYAGNTIVAQGNQIIAAGLADVCVEYLDKFQNTVTGFWSDKIDMHTGINGFLKITCFYVSAGAPIKHAELAANSAMTCLTSDEIGTTVCHLYNVYFALHNILVSLRKTGRPEDKEAAERVAAAILARAPEAIRVAKRKTEVFAKADGAFSYMRAHSVHKSQEAWVSVEGSVESDVNASVLSTSGLTNNIYSALDVPSEVRVPIFGDEDYGIFLANLKL